MVRFAPGTTYLLPSTSWLVREGVDAGETSKAPEASGPVATPDSTDPPPSVDPFEDADALEELGCEIATLAAHIHAATARLLELIAEFDGRRGWELGGHRSCAHWLAYRTGIALPGAREKVRTARALAGLPETTASMARGELSFSKVRALTRVATADTETDLLELARGCTTAELERVVRAWRKGSREDEAVRERALWESRTFSVFPDDEGMYVVRGRLPAEVGALLMRAVEAAGDALYREERADAVGGACAGGPAGPGRRSAGRGRGGPEASRRAAARRRADAVGLLAERALGAGFGTRGDADDEGGRSDDRDGAGADVPLSGTRAERYQVMLHVEPATLAATGEPGRSELEDGTRVSAETSRRLACDAAMVRVTHRPTDGSPRTPVTGRLETRPVLSVGRRTRTIPPALRRALEVRDRGCRFPGCGSRFTDAHHVKHWAEGGETSLANCLLLCRHHHRLVHEEGWQVGWWGEGRPVFFDPRGGAHHEGRWQPPAKSGEPRESERALEAEGRTDAGNHVTAGPGAPTSPQPLDTLLEDHELRGVRPDGWTASARWKREHDIPDRVLFAALEAAG